MSEFHEQYERVMRTAAELRDWCKDQAEELRVVHESVRQTMAQALLEREWLRNRVQEIKQQAGSL